MFTESSTNCVFCDIRKSTETMDSTVIVNVAVFPRLDNILK